ncbi:plasma membrane localization protein [Recurvomyces mirabilis]|uniref:Plasma membrane localization protein n=1 Tax=Recurvomyces mirabilis TaxID=574656 RepID=A0AAE1C1C7_9PEZI|nr:plasma membrane localization protein [Recurvomyces mirabilis]KAK5152705.1 plasma membrane localization protein [Recurvomyces mirabilis]
MPKTHLPAHMDSVRQKLRPKHQILILKCYPRLPKNSAADVKPNGSELSYLLFYASTRRSKLQKVGGFLERKTAKDVYSQASARVLVTLQILTALLENKVVGEGSPLALTAPYVMRIISGILLNTNDISLIEASQKTWDVFCKHQDQAVLAADHEYRELYEKVVGQYAEYAHKAGAKKLGKSVSPVATHDAIRLREAGLHATKSVITSDALAFESGRHVLTIAIPAILSNVRGVDGAYLENLLRESKRSESEEKDKAINRRQSMATVRTYTETSLDTDPRTAEGTAQDADAIAEEGVAVLALDCLKAVFTSENRAQTRSAAVALLDYLRDLQYYRRPQTLEKNTTDFKIDTWAVKAYEQCVAWTPVQDRFILLVTAVDTMIHLPLRERDLRQHQLLASLIDDTLRSDLNLIGLSVMDVLLGLIQQTLRILQYQDPPGAASSPVTSSNDELKPTTSGASAVPVGIASEARLQLIHSLKACIADLATHVYYTDQISDMISAILMRLKPSPAPIGQQNPLVTALAIEEPKSAVNEVASNASIPHRERSNSTSGFFSFDTARQVALEAVRDIIKVANSSRAMNSSIVADSRNPVHISIWEGTQWLLRDPAPAVRMAYNDALITWLEHETKKSDFRLDVPKTAPRKRAQDPHSAAEGYIGSTLARRAVSNASATKDRTQTVLNKRISSSQTFLQLLHLANYENVLQFASTSPQDIIMQSTLLATLVKRLGTNAVASGLPMIFALQEEIARVESPVGKVRIGTLVHGYLWAVVEVFNCQEEMVGRNILQEVARRKGHGIWVKEVEFPPLSMDTIRERTVSGRSEMEKSLRLHEELRAFDDREELVDVVLEHYQTTVASPTPSAPTSPGRNFTLPTSLDRSTSGYLGAKQLADPQLIVKARTAMVSKWSREECLAQIAAMAPKSVSLSGSRTSPVQVAALAAAAGAGNHRQLLAAVNTGPMRNGKGTPPKQRQQQQALGNDNERLASQNPDRRPSGSSAGFGAGKVGSSSAARPPVRVEELKKILAGGVFSTLGGGPVSHGGRQNGTMRGADDGDTASESMMTADDDLESEDGSMPVKKKGPLDVDTLLATIEVKETRRVGVGRPPY